jgi:16S rRNA (cytidine1402-2'-O)-methyltransferase
MGTLFLVATPIGNLEDISHRALRTLREARQIAAEDTRVTRKLLSHYDIHTPLISYFEHNKLSRVGPILRELDEGDVALVSDAGTPGLNDPGYELVRAVLEAGHEVSVIPGAASPVAALVCSGLATDAFLYLGYLPRKPAERTSRLRQVSELPFTLILLEAPHRLAATLSDLVEILGDREMAVARELTKMHEEVWRGKVREAIQHFHSPRGEFVLIVHGKAAGTRPRWSEDKVKREIRKRSAAGQVPTALAAEVSDESGWDRREIYRLASLQKKER